MAWKPDLQSISRRASRFDRHCVYRQQRYLRAISPVDLFHQTGITSAIAGRPNKQLSEVPGDIRDILRYQNPKTIVLETDCMFSGTNPGFKKGISPLEAEAAKVDVAGQVPSKATDADVAGQAPSKATNAPPAKTFLPNAKLCFKKATAHSWQLSTINFLCKIPR